MGGRPAIVSGARPSRAGADVSNSRRPQNAPRPHNGPAAKTSGKPTAKTTAKSAKPQTAAQKRAAQAEAARTAHVSPFRRWLERTSGPLLTRFARAPKWAVLLLLVSLMIGGLTLPTYLGAAMLLTLTLFLAWITALAWPALSPGGKAMRALVVGIMMGAIYFKATGQA